jgi:hypothetical protein
VVKLVRKPVSNRPTRDVLVAYGVRQELKRRGWNRKTWPPVPQQSLIGGR